MLRLIVLVLISLPYEIYYMIKTHRVIAHIDDHSEEERYSMCRRIVDIIMKNGRVRTIVTGRENLPDDGGYIMYPNHQGKYDVLGIFYGHDRPCTFLIDENRADLIFVREFFDLLKASKIDKTNARKGLRTINDIARQVKEGRRYIVFPEGGYDDNGNNVESFKPGTFNCSVKSKSPIIPVALIDSYKVFGVNSLKKITTQVHFLTPIPYEEYASMTTSEIAELVRSRINEAIRIHTNA